VKVARRLSNVAEIDHFVNVVEFDISLLLLLKVVIKMRCNGCTMIELRKVDPLLFREVAGIGTSRCRGFG
jgi:hypothetical protein